MGQTSYRRRMFQGGMPKDEDIETMKKYSNYAMYAILLCVLFGPFMCTFGMMFFCCMLKSLTDEQESAKERCIVTICGCGIFPVVFVMSFIFSVLAIVFMVLISVFLAEPYEV